ALAPILAAPAPWLHSATDSSAPSPAGGLGGKMLGGGAGKAATWLSVLAVCAAGGYGVWRSAHLGGQPPQNIAPAPLAQEDIRPSSPNTPPIGVEQLPLETTAAGEGVTTAAPARPREASRSRAVEGPA